MVAIVVICFSIKLKVQIDVVQTQGGLINVEIVDDNEHYNYFVTSAMLSTNHSNPCIYKPWVHPPTQ